MKRRWRRCARRSRRPSASHEIPYCGALSTDDNPPPWALTPAAHARKSPVVNARIRRCTVGENLRMSGTLRREASRARTAVRDSYPEDLPTARSVTPEIFTFNREENDGRRSSQAPQSQKYSVPATRHTCLTLLQRDSALAKPAGVRVRRAAPSTLGWPQLARSSLPAPPRSIFPSRQAGASRPRSAS